MPSVSPPILAFRAALRRAGTAAFAVAVAATLAACGGKDDKKPATQVAAKVNKEEISVHQINFVLQRTPGLPPERAAEAKKAILDRLIEQEVLVQAAGKAKLEREPDVLQQLEAARREILARAYLQKVASGAAKPTPAEVAEFYKAQPQLFTGRKIYKFNEILLGGRPANWAEIEKALAPTKSIQEAASVLRGFGIDATIATNSTRPSEQLPIAILPQLDKLKEGEVVIYQQPSAIVIAQITGIRADPVDEKRAGPVIEQFLVNKRRGEAVQTEVKRLRESAEVAYVGEFAAAAQAAPKAAAQSSAPAAPAAETKSAPSFSAPAGDAKAVPERAPSSDPSRVVPTYTPTPGSNATASGGGTSGLPAAPAEGDASIQKGLKGLN